VKGSGHDLIKYFITYFFWVVLCISRIGPSWPSSIQN